MKRKSVFQGMVLIPVFNLLFLSSLFAQNPFWTFPEQGFDGDGMFTLPTDDYTGQEADHVHAGLKDPYGEMLFFAMDGRLYNASGEENSEFDDGNELIRGTSEMLVVPQPWSCNRFYIFQARPKGTGQDSEFPHYSIYDDTLNILRPDLNNAIKTSWNMVDDYPNLPNWGDTDHGVRGVHFAATNEFKNGVRWIFVSSGNRLYRVNLSCDGLESFNIWQYSIHPGFDELLERGWRSELELYEDTAADVIRVAAPYNRDFFQGDDRIKIMVLELDSASGVPTQGGRVDITIPDQTDDLPSFVHGLEFSPDGSLLYIIHDPYPGAPSPLSYYDFSTSGLTNLNCTDILDFENTQIQLAGDSGNYSLYFASEDYLGTLTDPDNPSCSNWTPNAIPFLGGYSTNLGGNPATSLRDIKRLVPDQIDFMDYDTTFIKASCDCCRKYAYAQDKQDTSKIIVGGTNWSPGFASNPWGAGVNDTIFIRDSILVKRGVNLTISNLNFRFGKEGVFIVERGDEVTPGAIVTLTDSTHMTTDFRCSGREYTCRDPKNDLCDTLNFWQGIRVEGFPNESQALSGSTVQGRLNMEKGCTIEYATIGILAGHEDFDEYGGGIVRIRDSFVKDSPISIRFEKYVAVDGGSNEIFNEALVHNMHFYWTNMLKVLKYLPKYHVDIIESSGIRLRGNRYELVNWTVYLEKNRGIGIHSFNSRVSAKWLCNETTPAIPCQSPELRSTFLNMTKGFYASVSGSSRTIEAGYGVYENNSVGIHCIGLIDPLLLDNEFRVPNADNRSGITLTNSTGYAVENNYFTSMYASPVNNNIGTYVQSSGPANNEIYNNLYKNITIGIASIEDNADCDSIYQSGLRWKCNRFDQQIPFADIYMHSGNVSNDQGECQAPDRPAGNLFSHTNGAMDIRINAAAIEECFGVFFDIDYNHHDVTGASPFIQRLEPLTFTILHVDPFMCPNVFPSQSDCPVINSATPPGKGGVGTEGKSEENEMLTLSDYQLHFDELYTIVSNNESLNESNPYLADLYYSWNSFIRSAQWDSLNNFPKESVLGLLNQYEPSSFASRYASAIAGELGAETPAWINSVENLSFSADEVGLFGIESADLPYEIAEFIDASYFNSASNTAAFVELYHENEKVFEPIPMIIESELPDSYGDAEGKSNKTAEDGRLINVRPNPFDQTFMLSFESSGEYSNTRIVFYDLLGRTISDNNYGQISQVEIDGSKFPSGVLIYSVYLDGKLFDTGRIVKAH